MNKRYLPGPTWTEQDEKLRSMWQAGSTPHQIAEALSRSIAAIMTRAARLGLPRRFSPGRKPGSARASTTSNGVRSFRPPSRKISDNVNKQLRACLMCASDFYSSGAHNRICPKCKESPEYASACRLPDLDVASFS